MSSLLVYMESYANTLGFLGATTHVYQVYTCALYLGITFILRKYESCVANGRGLSCDIIVGPYNIIILIFQRCQNIIVTISLPNSLSLSLVYINCTYNVTKALYHLILKSIGIIKRIQFDYHITSLMTQQITFDSLDISNTCLSTSQYQCHKFERTQV